MNHKSPESADLFGAYEPIVSGAKKLNRNDTSPPPPRLQGNNNIFFVLFWFSVMIKLDLENDEGNGINRERHLNTRWGLKEMQPQWNMKRDIMLDE